MNGNYLADDKKVVSLIGTTASLLRYALDYSSREVTIFQEAEAVGNYVSIQEQRFEDRIHFVFDLDETFHETIIPSLILQPLVENAVAHGVGMYESGGEITICSRYDPAAGMGKLSVIDNGEGMDRETVRKVYEKMIDSGRQTTGIGLANAYLRLKLFFGDRADVQISSQPGVRTEVALLFPCGRKDATEGRTYVYSGNSGR